MVSHHTYLRSCQCLIMLLYDYLHVYNLNIYIYIYQLELYHVIYCIISISIIIIFCLSVGATLWTWSHCHHTFRLTAAVWWYCCIEAGTRGTLFKDMLRMLPYTHEQWQFCDIWLPFPQVQARNYETCQLLCWKPANFCVDKKPPNQTKAPCMNHVTGFVASGAFSKISIWPRYPDNDPPEPCASISYTCETSRIFGGNPAQPCWPRHQQSPVEFGIVPSRPKLETHHH